MFKLRRQWHLLCVCAGVLSCYETGTRSTACMSRDDFSFVTSPTFEQFWARESCDHLVDSATAWWAKLRSSRADFVDGTAIPDTGSGTLTATVGPGFKAFQSIASGAAAGAFGKFVVYPMDTVKKRLQVGRCLGHSTSRLKSVAIAVASTSATAAIPSGRPGSTTHC